MNGTRIQIPSCTYKYSSATCNAHVHGPSLPLLPTTCPTQLAAGVRTHTRQVALAARRGGLGLAVRRAVQGGRRPALSERLGPYQAERYTAARRFRPRPTPKPGSCCFRPRSRSTAEPETPETTTSDPILPSHPSLAHLHCTLWCPLLQAKVKVDRTQKSLSKHANPALTLATLPARLTLQELLSFHRPRGAVWCLAAAAQRAASEPRKPVPAGEMLVLLRWAGAWAMRAPCLCVRPLAAATVALWLCRKHGGRQKGC